MRSLCIVSVSKTNNNYVRTRKSSTKVQRRELGRPNAQPAAPRSNKYIPQSRNTQNKFSIKQDHTVGKLIALCKQVNTVDR